MPHTSRPCGAIKLLTSSKKTSPVNGHPGNIPKLLTANTIFLLPLIYPYRNQGRSQDFLKGGGVVSFAAIIRVVTQRSSPLTAAHLSSAFLSSN